jgi:hypothetical protein
LLGKKMYPGIPSSAASGSATEQKKSGTSAVSGFDLDAAMLRSRARRWGMERPMSSSSSVSMGVSAGRSSDGRATPASRREASTAECASGAERSVKVTTVEARP